MKPHAQRLILISFVFLLSFISLHSQLIYFYGTDKASGATVNIDSIKIINTTLNLDTIITGNSFDLSLLDVENENVNVNNAPFDVGQIPSNDGNSLSFRINAHQNISLSIRIYNLIGIQISSYQQSFAAGVHDIKLNEYLIPGVYFASFSNGSTIRTIKIMESGEPFDNLIYNQNAIQEKKEILKYDSYTFIGYSKGYRKDTISNPPILVGYSYEFKFAKIDYGFNIMQLTLSPVSGTFHYDKWEYHRYTDSTSKESYDTYYYLKKIYWDNSNCNYNKNSVLEGMATCDTNYLNKYKYNYCCSEGINGEYSGVDSNFILHFNLDTINYIITELSIKKSSGWYTNPTGDDLDKGYEIYEFLLKNIPYQIQDDGSLTCEILYKNFLNYVEDKNYYYYHYWYYGYGIHVNGEQYTQLKTLYSNTNNSNVCLSLILRK
jgi:hypothetical protein